MEDNKWYNRKMVNQFNRLGKKNLSNKLDLCGINCKFPTVMLKNRVARRNGHHDIKKDYKI